MKIDISMVLGTFEKLPFIIEQYVSNIPEADMDIRRNEDAWTIREHLYHIAGVQEMLSARIEQIIKEPEPVIEPYFPENEPENSRLYDNLERAFREYKRERERQLSMIRLMNNADWEKEAFHPEYREYNIPLLLNHIIFHEYWHMYRIEEIWLTREEYFR